MKNINENEFVNSYLTTAAWVTCDSNECQDFTRDAKKQAKADLMLFISEVVNEFGSEKANELLSIAGNDLTYLAPHDFFLTRNYHGAGFWDKEDIYGEDEAKKLTAISHKFPTADCYHIRGKKSKLTF